jgi:precorrin-3B C17-methyltransferase
VTGRLTVIGLGPGDPRWLTPAAAEALAAATDLVGYGPYVDRVPHREGLARHVSDNRVELDRARHALDLASEGRAVAVVSGGDPGIFAMAAAVFEALEEARPAWAAIDIRVEPGITAVLAAAARLGAPLGGDFAVLSLSDNLKPWAVVLRRLEAALAADFVVALYNPISTARPWQLGEALKLAGAHRAAEAPVAFARAVGRPDEAIRVLPLVEAVAVADSADMATLVLIGASATRWVGGPEGRRFLYTPRSVGRMP